MVTIASAHEYITEQEKQGKTDREIFDGILDLDGDVWHVVELVRDLGWSIGRFEASQIGDEFFRENREYIRGVFAGNCDDAMQAGVNFVDSCRNEDGKLDEAVTYPEFLQILVNANAPAWPTFVTKAEDEAATTAAWEYWGEQVGKQQDERNAQAVFETQKAEANRRFHEDLRYESKNS